MSTNQFQSNNMGLGLTPAGGAGATPTLTGDTDRPVILGALSTTSGRGIATALRVATWDLIWSNQGFPLSALGLGSAMSSENYAGLALFPGQGITLNTLLDANGSIGGMWSIDDLESDAEAMAFVERLVKSRRPPGRINWLFGQGQVNLLAATPGQQLTASAARPGRGPGMLIVDVGGAPALNDVQLVDVQIKKVSQMANTRPIEASLLGATNFNRYGLYIDQDIPVNTPITLVFDNANVAPIPVSAGWMAMPPKNLARDFVDLRG